MEKCNPSMSTGQVGTPCFAELRIASSIHLEWSVREKQSAQERQPDLSKVAADRQTAQKSQSDLTKCNAPVPLPCGSPSWWFLG